MITIIHKTNNIIPAKTPKERNMTKAKNNPIIVVREIKGLMPISNVAISGIAL